MPRYFIDTDDGHTVVVDDEGYDLADHAAARDLALRALSDMARDTLSENDRRAYTSRIRAEDGSAIYGASLTLTGEWWGAPPA